MNATITLGDFQLTILSGGRFWIDGGNMFGVIPRTLWQRKMPPDEQNRILLETNCVLVRTPESLGLIDTGYGSKAPVKIRERYCMEDVMPLLKSLATANVQPSEIDWVILTHLHFDHVGGCTYRDEQNQLRPTFPRARHFIQSLEWEDATGNAPELAGSYFQDDFMPLLDSGLIEFVETDLNKRDAEIMPGITTRLTGGHTRGHVTVTLKSQGQSAVCAADICPTVAHLPTFWSMAYDQFPLDVRRVKPVVLQEILDNGQMILFSHDPEILAGKLCPSDRQMAVESIA